MQKVHAQKVKPRHSSIRSLQSHGVIHQQRLMHARNFDLFVMSTHLNF